MDIFVDENIPSITVETLRKSGHDVKDIRGTKDEGISDDEIWQLTQAERRLLITTDKGFSRFRNQSHYGILIVRLRKPNQQKIHERVIGTINQIKEDEWKGLIVVVRDSVRSIWKATKSQ
jgi:predicted nuclease of predicted toxin-antitoxin system